MTDTATGVAFDVLGEVRAVVEDVEGVEVAELGGRAASPGGFRRCCGPARPGRGAGRPHRRRVAERELLWARWTMADTVCDSAVGEPIAAHLHALAKVTDDPELRRLGLNVWAIQCWHLGRLGAPGVLRRIEQAAARAR